MNYFYYSITIIVIALEKMNEKEKVKEICADGSMRFQLIPTLLVHASGRQGLNSFLIGRDVSMLLFVLFPT